GEGYAGQLPGATVWHLLPMQPGEVEPFFVRWFRDDAQGVTGLLERLRPYPALMRLAEVPLVAALLCWLWESGEGEWPKRAAPLLAACVRRLFEQTGAKLSLDRYAVGLALATVEDLAFGTFDGKRWVVDPAAFEQALSATGVDQSDAVRR